MIKYLYGKFHKLFLVPKILKNSKIAKSSKVCSGVEMNNVKIEDYSYVGHNTKINNTIIGKFCSIAGDCFIGGSTHPISWVSTSPIFHTKKSILGKGWTNLKFKTNLQTIIGSDVWIGSNVMIKGGVSIGNGAIIGMGSIVTHDVPPYEIWAGNPARFIRKRFDMELCERLEKIQWWNFSIDKIKNYAYLFDSPKEFLNVFEREVKK